MEDLVWSMLLLGAIAVLGILLGGGGRREDLRARRRWDAAFDSESRRTSHTDATGGPHWPSPARWGLSTAQLPDERVVHNLEHGGIVIDHNAIGGDDLAKLTSLLSTYPRDKYGEVKIVIQPYERIAPGTIVLTAWG